MASTSVDIAGDILYVQDVYVGNTTPGNLAGTSVSSFMTGTTANNIAGTMHVLNSSTATAGGVSTPGILFGSTGGPGIYYGISAPTISAATGSMYFRTDTGATASTYLYYNTTGVSTWAAVL
jgi:hypothetical protein